MEKNSTVSGSAAEAQRALVSSASSTMCLLSGRGMVAPLTVT